MHSSPTFLSVDIGGTKVAAGLVRLGEKPAVLTSRRIATEAKRGSDAVLADVVALVEGLLAEAPGAVTAIGIGSAGVIDSDSGTVLSATDLLPGWAGTPLGPEVAGATGLPVFVTGDVLAHALGEHFLGAGRQYESCMAVGIGTGVGGAFVDQGKVRAGAHGVSGHVGHIRHPLARDLVCSCGRVGHVESVASGTAISAEYARLTGEKVSGREVDERANSGDVKAGVVTEAAGIALGEVIAGLANAWDPAVIILSGSVTNSGLLWWDALNRGFAAQAMDPVASTPLIRGQLGGDAPLFGAAIFAGEGMGSRALNGL